MNLNSAFSYVKVSGYPSKNKHTFLNDFNCFHLVELPKRSKGHNNTSTFPPKKKIFVKLLFTV